MDETAISQVIVIAHTRPRARTKIIAAYAFHAQTIPMRQTVKPANWWRGCNSPHRCCGSRIRVDHVRLHVAHQACCGGIMLTDAQACELLVERYREFLAEFNTPLVE